MKPYLRYYSVGVPGVEGGGAPWDVVNIYAFPYPLGGAGRSDSALLLRREFIVRLGAFGRAEVVAPATTSDWPKVRAAKPIGAAGGGLTDARAESERSLRRLH